MAFTLSKTGATAGCGAREGCGLTRVFNGSLQVLEESRLKGSKGRNREMCPGAISARVHNGLDLAVLGVSRVMPIECADGLDVRHETKAPRMTPEFPGFG